MWEKIKKNTRMKRIVAFVMAVCMMTGMMQGMDLLELFDNSVEVQAASVITEGNYIYLKTSECTWWGNDGVRTWIYYFDDVSNGVKEMTAVPGLTNAAGNSLYYQVLVDSDMVGKDYIFIRRNGSYTSFSWDSNNYRQTPDLVNSKIRANSNVYVYNGTSRTGYWANEWLGEYYGGKTLYFCNMDKYDTNLNAGVKTQFYASSNGALSSYVNGTSDGITYSFTIPTGQFYDTVRFYDNNNNFIEEATLIDGNFNPITKNTYYYKNTVYADSSYVSQGWDTKPETESLNDVRLYFSYENYEYSTENKLYVYNVQVSMETVNDTIHSYLFSGSQTTHFKFVDENGTRYNFIWNDQDSDLAICSSDIAYVRGRYVDEENRIVYFDATFSKYQYGGFDKDGDYTDGNNGLGRKGRYSIPGIDNQVTYYATGSGMADIKGTMEKVPQTVVEGRTYSDLYKVVLPKGYTHITFANYNMVSATDYRYTGECTVQMEIPYDEFSTPCFSADTGDDYVYKGNDNNQRAGIWQEAFSVRDTQKRAEQDDNVIVDIPVGTDTRENTESKLYETVTFYDYYSDYELNGKNRDDYEYEGFDHRIYQPFRQFNQALSSFYEQYSADYPMYYGNFQHYNGSPYYEIASDMALYGSDREDFFYINNSMWGNQITGGGYTQSVGTSAEALSHGKNALQGLVNSKLSNGDLMIDGSETVKAPFFDKDFILGNNSKNAVLGDVYENVTFPFNKKAQKGTIERQGDGTIVQSEGKVDYWYFNSQDGSPNLRLTYDSEKKSYFLNQTNEVVKGKTTSGETEKGNFFPFNGSQQSGNSGTLNYGFGFKLEVKFRLTENGMVQTTKDDEYVPIEFNFSGDDDVWIYVDDALALDIGGDHGVVSGYIDFSGEGNTKNSYVSSVKSGGNNLTANKHSTFDMKGSNTDEHTLTIYYMERGLWESNLYLSFNFLSTNTLEVEKEVDISEVNELFTKTAIETGEVKNLLENYLEKDFTFGIQNYATHFPASDAYITTDGFSIKQFNIRDYGSVLAGGLVNPVGAEYTKNYKSTIAGETDKQRKWKCSNCDKIVYSSTKPTVCSECSQTGSFEEEKLNIENDGEFVLSDGQSVDFVDQFRRGSYISLEEKEPIADYNPDLFTTKWTMYENGKEVHDLKDGDGLTVINPAKVVVDDDAGKTNYDLVDMESRFVDDGRIEKILTGTSDEIEIANTGYTYEHRPDNSFVFRSYATPDKVTGSTTLKALYENKVNVGRLKINKNSFYDFDEMKGRYTFKVEFTNVGGEYLERLWKCTTDLGGAECGTIVNGKESPDKCLECTQTGNYKQVYRYVCKVCGHEEIGTEMPNVCGNNECQASASNIEQRAYSIIRTYTIDLSDADTSNDSIVIEGIPVGTEYTITEISTSDRTYLVDAVDRNGDIKSNNDGQITGTIEKARVWVCTTPGCGHVITSATKPVQCPTCAQSDCFEDCTDSYTFRNAETTEVSVEKIWKNEDDSVITDNAYKAPVNVVLQRRPKGSVEWKTLIYDTETNEYSEFSFATSYSVYNDEKTDIVGYLMGSATGDGYDRFIYDSEEGYILDEVNDADIKHLKFTDEDDVCYEYDGTTGEWKKLVYDDTQGNWVADNSKKVIFTLNSNAEAELNWKNTFYYLHRYVEDLTEATDLTEYEYRVVEFDNTNGKILNQGDATTFVGTDDTERIYDVEYKYTWTCEKPECGHVNTVYLEKEHKCSECQTVNYSGGKVEIANIYSTETTIQITKVDAVDTTKKLSGVTFELEKMNNDASGLDTDYKAWKCVNEGCSSEIIFATSVPGVCRKCGATDKFEPVYSFECAKCHYVTVSTSKPDSCSNCEATSDMIVQKTYNQKYTTDMNGIARFKGLSDGIYKITETDTQDGYSLLANPIYIKIDHVSGRSGIYDLTGHTVKDEDVIEVKKNTIAITVSNRQKFVFPDTGGNGRLTDEIIGISLILMSFLVLWIRIKKESGYFSDG